MPNVKSSRPLEAIVPLGLDILLSVLGFGLLVPIVSGMTRTNCLAVCWSRRRGVRNMKARSKRSTNLNTGRIQAPQDFLGYSIIDGGERIASLDQCLEMFDRVGKVADYVIRMVVRPKP